MARKVTVPRGIRNNNPGNLRCSAIDWQGQVGCDPDDFCVFDTAEHGILAMCKNLHTYMTVHQLDTIRGIIARWAPTDDGNKPLTYAKAVAAYTGYGIDETLLVDYVTISLLAGGICEYENGEQPYDLGLFIQAAEEAVGGH